MKIGQARYGKGKKTFKLVDGDNVYRILPPLGSLADKGKWSIYYRIEWGYKDSNSRHRPFQCPRVVNRQTKMVEVESAAYLNREQLKRDKDKVVENFKQGLATQEQVKEAVKLVERYNQEAKHYLGVVNLNNEIGLLKIGHRVKLSLDTAIENLRKQGVDPLSLGTGVFFNFHRSCPTGNFRDTVYQVSPYQENIQAQINGINTIVQQKKMHVMDDGFINRLSSEAFDLGELYPVVTAEQVQRMVVEGVPAIEEILGKVEQKEEAKKPVHQAVSTPVAAPATQTTTVSVAPATPVAAPATPVETAPVEAPATPVETAPVGAPATPVAAPVEAPTTNINQKSDDDFLREIGALD